MARQIGICGQEKALKLLLIDTCGVNGSFDLVNTDLSTHHAISLEGRSASERLMPELRAAFSHLRWNLGHLAAIGVVAGPGSFTGVRVGLAAAKGLCEAAELPLVLISRLAVLASKFAPASSQIVHPLLDAGRGEVFYGRYAPHEPPVEALLTREAVLEAVHGGAIVACEPEVQARFPELRILMTTPLSAEDALHHVIERVRREVFDDVASADPNYLRRTDLEVLETLRRRASAR